MKRTRKAAKTAVAIEKTIAALPDPPKPTRVSGTVGNVFFDDANTTQCSRCIAKSSDVNNNEGLVLVDIDIDPDGFAHIQVNSEMHFASDTRQHLNLNWHQLEPLAVALSRAVSNAKARGFLPTSDGAAT